ncbi:MAG: phosphoribosylamine--glycine ligase [Gammaproteobacteria bacterium]|nr:phosphoribosylamine--glycine ligase [Gammaproteobacteria bacterium]MDE2346412.1 phosphoribosylamine--glycine ligase [Gammaproteobacteria bacterium]
MKVLVIGNGGREHALAWKLAQSPKVDRVYVAPGNAGTARERKCENLRIAADELSGLLDFALGQGIGMTVVGPEGPLVAGITDVFQQAGLRCFGPSRAAARLEGSKAFSKDFLARHHIPTADYRCFTELKPALEYLKQHGAPLVVKADGLAAGKGVVVAQSLEEAEIAVRDMLAGNAFGDAGHKVVIEDFLEGEEASFMVMADGEHILPLATSQDHKRVGEGDTGPNTGGMGAYSPAPVVSREIHERVVREIIQPTIRGMAAEGAPYTGFLYAGLMISPQGEPRVLEFNCRLGDPETQPIMLRLKSDLVDLCEAALAGKLDKIKVEWDTRMALGVVLVAGGYPGEYRKGEIISGLPPFPMDNVKVFHAGTAIQGSRVATNGGRVLCVTALGDNIGDARQRAYHIADGIRWPGRFFRRDIGWRAMQRDKQQGNKK